MSPARVLICAIAARKVVPWSRARRLAEMASRWDNRPRPTSRVMMGLKNAFLRLLSSLG